VFHKTGEQRLVTNGIDQPGNAVAVTKNPPERRTGEMGCALRAGQFEPVLDVLDHLSPVQRLEMITHRDALAKLAKTRAVEPGAQFRLPHQDDLQQLAVVQFEIRQQPHLFEQFVGEILRLVNDQHHVLALLDLIEQKIVDGGERVMPVQVFDVQRNSVPMALINSSAFSTGLRMTAVVKLMSSCRSIARQIVVLPAPTSPVSCTKPLRSRMP